MDTNLGGFDVFLLLFFEYHRGNKTERAVAPRRVVERLEVVEDGKLSVLAAGGSRLIQSGVGLQGAPERFHRGVVVAIAGTPVTRLPRTLFSKREHQPRTPSPPGCAETSRP